MKPSHLLMTVVMALAAGLALTVALVVSAGPDTSNEPAELRNALTADAGDLGGEPVVARGVTSRGAKAVDPGPPSEDIEPASRPVIVRRTVEVVRAETGAPLPGAAVWCWAKRYSVGGDGGFPAWLHNGRVEAHLEEATELGADAQGLVELPETEHGCFVTAAYEDLWGYASFDAHQFERERLALVPDADLRVQVVDAAGAPLAGVPVALRQHLIGSALDHLTARTEGPEGVAVLRHAGWYLDPRSGPKASLVVAVQGLIDPSLERAVDREGPLDGLLHFVLGQTGSCEVQVVDTEGHAVTGALEARLRFADRGGDPATGNWRSESISSRSGEGVVFEHVSLGRELAVTVARERSGRVMEARGPGPTRPGERTRLLVQLEEDVAVLRGRVFDVDGTPASSRVLRVSLEAEYVGLGPAWIAQTAGDGRFSVDGVPGSEIPEGAALAVYLVSDDGTEVASARQRLPEELLAGSHDLGDFVLSEIPVVLSGVVVDERGDPVTGAAVTASIVLSEVPVGSGAGPSKAWLRPGRSTSGGRFEIRGNCASEAITLQGRKGSLVCAPLVVQAGRRDVELILRAAGAIDGELLLDPSMSETMILVQAEPGDGRDGANADVKTSVADSSGHFELRGLRAVPHTIRVVFASNGQELARMEGVSVEAGQATRDPRLNPLDLREQYRLVELEPVDEHGEGVKGGRAFTRPSDGSSDWRPCRSEGGRLHFLSDGRPHDVVISVAGFVRTELERVTTSRRVTMRRAAQLRFYLASGLRVPDSPLSLGLELTPLETGASIGIANIVKAGFDEQGELSCKSPYTGEVRVDLVLVSSDPDHLPRIRVREEAPRIIHVSNHSLEQLFEIRFAPADLEEAIRSIRETP